MQAERPSSASVATQPNKPAIQGYTLTPERRAKAVAYSRAQYGLYFFGTAFALALYALLARSKAAVKLRDLAYRASRRHSVQCLIFAPCFFVIVALLEFPLDYYGGFFLERRYGLSAESFAIWLGDWTKGLALDVALATFLVWLFYLVVRRSPLRWWIYSWLATLPLALALVFLDPLVVSPLFFRYTPLETTRPELTARTELMLRRAGLAIPRLRMFEMNASLKTTALNAYVTGVGTSKRVVVYDTVLSKLDEDETLLVIGHEAGHYVLNHIPKGLALFALASLAGAWFLFLALRLAIERFGVGLGLEGAGDLATLPVVLACLTLLMFLASPIYCAASRHFEHQADQFGLEVAHGVVPDANDAEARALQALGEVNLADPAPSPFIKFWLYTHPGLDERIRFALAYRPWEQGKALELVKPRQ